MRGIPIGISSHEMDSGYADDAAFDLLYFARWTTDKLMRPVLSATADDWKFETYFIWQVME